MVPFLVYDKEDEEEEELAVNRLGMWNFRNLRKFWGIGRIWEDLAEFGSVSGVQQGR